MKSSIFVSAIVACAFMLPVVSAQETSAATTPMTQQMPQVQANMTKMQQQMDKIQATADPKEREKLLQEHMQAMQDNMKIMRGMAGAMMKDKIDNPDRLQTMEMRMNMMQMMMDQMIQHNQAVESIPTKYLRVAVH